LRVDCLGSVEAYNDLEFFIGAVDDASQMNRLAAAIKGRGAFPRSRDALGAWPEQVERWYAIPEERQRGRARAWLAEGGYCASPVPESLGPAVTNDPLPYCRRLRARAGLGHAAGRSIYTPMSAATVTITKRGACEHGTQR
jgi:hypothetical protein